MAVRVRDLDDRDRPWLRALIEDQWGLPVVTPTGVYADPESHEGVVAEVDGVRAGVATFIPRGDGWEVVTVISTLERAGAGRAVLEAVRDRARRAGAARVWLITTDDTGALPFYERLGMVRAGVHADFVDVVRRAKPATGGYRNAYELEWRLAVT